MARRRKSDDPLALIITIMLLLPIAAFWLLKQVVTLIAVGVQKINSKKVIRTTYPHTITRKTSASHKTNATYSTQRTPQKEARSSKNTASSTTQKTASSEGNKISLYEALRIPGDPDPSFGGCTCFVGESNNYTTQGTTDYDYDDEYDEEYDEDDIDNIEEEIDIDESDTILMGLALHDLFTKDKDEEYEDDGFNDDSDYSWETHCEFCGELLEDCVCDHRHESHEAISLWNCGCDDDDWGSSDRNDDRAGLADFDEFSSFR